MSHAARNRFSRQSIANFFYLYQHHGACDHDPRAPHPAAVPDSAKGIAIFTGGQVKIKCSARRQVDWAQL